MEPATHRHRRLARHRAYIARALAARHNEQLPAGGPARRRIPDGKGTGDRRQGGAPPQKAAVAAVDLGRPERAPGSPRRPPRVGTATCWSKQTRPTEAAGPLQVDHPGEIGTAAGGPISPCWLKRLMLPGMLEGDTTDHNISSLGRHTSFLHRATPGPKEGSPPSAGTAQRIQGNRGVTATSILLARQGHRRSAARHPARRPDDTHPPVLRTPAEGRRGHV